MPKKSTRSDGRYEIKRTIPAEYSLDGKSFRKSFYSTISEQDCINQYNAYLLELGRLSATGVRLPSETTKFEKWATTWLTTYKQGKVKANTYKETYEHTVKNYLIPYFENIDLDKIKPIDVQTFFNKQAEQYSQSALNKMYLCLKGMFDKALDNGIVPKNPTKGIEVKSAQKPTEKRTYTQEQYDMVIEFARDHPLGHVIRLMLEVGLRCSELCGVQYRDFDLWNKTIHLHRSCTTVNYRPFISEEFKNSSSKRSLPISSDLCEQIRQASLHHEKTDFLVTGTAEPITPAKFSTHGYKVFFEELCLAHPDIEALTPHELRHTCGTLLYANSKDIYAVSKYLGHSSIDITVKTYVHDTHDMLRDHLHIV